MPRFIVIDSGGVARTITRLPVVDAGGTTRLIKRGFIIDAGGVARLFFASGPAETVTLVGDTISFSSGTPGQTATWVFQNDGTILRQGVQYGAGVQWIDSQPTPAGEYWLRATHISGAAPNAGTLNTWLKIAGSGSASETYTWTSNGVSDVVGSVLIEIASDSAGANILDSGVFGANINDI